MRATSAVQPTLISALWPSAHAGILRMAALAVVGSLLLAVSAKVQVPFWPVPMTLQTFAVLVIGMAYGPRLGAATVALYLMEGAFGMPVFATGLGLAYMAGPTGGYLAGFLAAVVLVGFLAQRGWDRTIPATLAAMILGTAVIFACGLAWLSALIGLEAAVAAGLLPVLPGAAVKIALGAAVLPFAWKILGRA